MIRIYKVIRIILQSWLDFLALRLSNFSFIYIMNPTDTEFLSKAESLANTTFHF